MGTEAYNASSGTFADTAAAKAAVRTVKELSSEAGKDMWLYGVRGRTAGSQPAGTGERGDGR